MLVSRHSIRNLFHFLNNGKKQTLVLEGMQLSLTLFKYTSFCCGIFLALMFTITSLKNPGIDTAMKPTKYRTGIDIY